MDLSAIIITAAIVGILANLLKVWEFGSFRLVAYIKNPKSTFGSLLQYASL